jgi:hypothetical protein
LQSLETPALDETSNPLGMAESDPMKMEMVGYGVATATVRRDDVGAKPINLTPKKIALDLKTPLREHLDKAAIQRGWELFKQTK